MTEYTFIETDPPADVRIVNRAPNPFLERVQSIAGQINPDTGKPRAMAFQVPTATEADNVNLALVLRQLRNVSNSLKMDPPQSVKAVTSPVTTTVKGVEKVVPNVVQVTFWTMPKIPKPRKPKITDVPAVASANDDAANVETPAAES